MRDMRATLVVPPLTVLLISLIHLPPSPANGQKEPLGPAPAESDPDDGPTYLLRYKFRKGQSVRWSVEHSTKVEITVSGVTQEADSATNSVKLWKVKDVDAQGKATYAPIVERVEMRRRLPGRPQVRHDSRTDDDPPSAFKDGAESVGVPRSEVTIDPMGAVIQRQEKHKAPAVARPAHVAIPLPKEAIAVGHEWFVPDEVLVTTEQ